MGKLGILGHIEQSLRVLTLTFYFVQLSWFVILYPLMEPLFSFINRISNRYFSKNARLRDPVEYIGKGFSVAAMKILGIDYIIENNGVIQKITTKDTNLTIHSNSASSPRPPTNQPL